MIKVLVVDDHELVRAGIVRMLSDINGIEVTGQCDSGEGALEQIREHPPDVVLMDVRMPGMGGLEATRRALRIDPDLKIIAVTVCDEEPFPSRLLEAGAQGYVTKGANMREMVSAIRKVHVGQRYLSADVAQQLALKPYQQDQRSPFDMLSSREMQISMMVVSCFKVQDISVTLHLSPKTVNSYRYRIFDKLNISSDVELALLAIKHGMIDPAAGQLAEA
ncbi:MAG: UvrY/SirA/GacA family response regulator transcription factor [Pseudomonadales bacterium]